jgi:gamma-glutamylcyclotransferase (GGCT)/AIG2-like uncharacterized protein YtfP
MNIFTYGTLMFPEVWRAVVGREFPAVAGALRGYSAFRVRDAVYPGVLKLNGNTVVDGILYLDVDEPTVARLDRFEGELYVRPSVTIACADGRERIADTYVVPPQHAEILTAEPWTRDWFLSSGSLEEFLQQFAGFQRIGTAG